MRSSFSPRSVFALLLVACGSAASESYNPPLATLHGTITSAAVTTSPTVRVALVWNLPLSATNMGATFRATQELDVRAEFPASFRLDVRNVPPAEVMQTVDSSKQPGGPTAYAMGTLVVYEDTNQNGKLDLIPQSANASADRVLGAPERLEIIYLEGGSVPKTAGAPTSDIDSVDLLRGFNLVLEPETAPLAPGCSDCGSPVGAWARLDTSAALPIALTANPQLSRSICELAGGVSVGGSGSCKPCHGEQCADCKIPAGTPVTCNADRTAFVAHACTGASVCDALLCQTISGQRDSGAPAPVSWPCP